MDTIQKAVEWAVNIANDNSHGYQWGGNGPVDYDCSGLVNAAWIAAGVNVNDVLRNTTYTIKAQYARHGFTDVTKTINLGTGAGLQAGDVLVNETNHMAMYIGNGKLVQARSNLDGKTGDSSGQEIRTQTYYNYPWNVVMRYTKVESEPAQKQTTKMESVYLPQLSKGSKGEAVRSAQRLLIAAGKSCGPSGADGDFGLNTHTATILFQRSKSLDADGIIGPETWAALIGGVDA